MNRSNIAFHLLEMELRGRSTTLVVVECFIHLVVILSALIGNSLVLLVLVKNHNLKTITNKLIVSLAISDILLPICGALPSFVVLVTSEWKFGFILCQFQGISIIILAVASVTTLMIMAVNRYYRVVKTQRYNRVFTVWTTKWMICGSWGFAFIAPWPYLLAGHAFVFHPGKFFCYKNIDDGNAIIFSTMLVSVYAGIPLVIITLSYFLVFRAVKTHASHMAHSKTITAADIKITKTLFLLVLTFVFSWSPVIIVDIIDSVWGGTSMPRSVYVVYTFCGLLSSVFDPIIYSVRNRGFRTEIMRICCLKRRQVLPFETEQQLNRRSTLTLDRGTTCPNTMLARRRTHKRQHLQVVEVKTADPINYTTTGHTTFMK